MSVDHFDENLNTVSSLPAVANEIVALTCDANQDLEAWVKVIESDASLCRSVLAELSLDSVAQLREASVLSVSLAALRMVFGPAINVLLETFQSSYEENWAHSLRSAISARKVAAEVLNLEKPGQAFLIGLLHDIGKITMDRLLAKEDREKIEALEAESSSFLEVEEALTQTNHAKLGEALAKQWGLPDFVVHGIRHHHRPSDADSEQQKLVLAVHLGDMFTMMAGVGAQLDNMSYVADDLADQYITRNAKWELRTFPTLLLNIDKEFEEAIAAVSGGHNV